jgi:hypothetical protein
MTFHAFSGLPRPTLAESFGPFDLFALSGPVGSGPTNTGVDVAKVQTLLAAGEGLDLAPDDGPSGRADARFGGALRGVQKTLGLAVDGLVNPDGPTIQKLAATPGPGRFGAKARLIRSALPLIRGSTADRMGRDADLVLGNPGSGRVIDHLIAIWNQGMPGMITAIDLLGRVGERDRGMAADLRRAVAPGLAAADRPLLFAGDLVRRLARDEFAAGENIVQKTITQSKQPAQHPKTPPPPPVQVPAPIPVPAYRRSVFQRPVNRTAWSDFSLAVLGTPGLSRVEQRAFTEFFAAEGGMAPDGSTVAGITSSTLDGLVRLGLLPGIKIGTSPKNLSMIERVRVYKAYFDDALHLTGGSSGLRHIQDQEVAAAFADTLLRNETIVRQNIIRSAINDVAPNRVAAAGKFRRDEIKALSNLAADPGTKRALLDAIVVHRKRVFANHPNKAGEFKRIEHFRFPRHP